MDSESIDDEAVITFQVEGFDGPEEADFVKRMLTDYGLGQVILTRILTLLPDPTAWRLTISGDMVSTVNRICGLSGDSSYTVQRGSGEVGGRTMKAEDGTFDIVLSGVLLFPDPANWDTLDDCLKWISDEYQHLAAHESGHGALGQRGEDADVFVPLVDLLLPTELIWRNSVGIYVVELRCDQYANRVAPVGTTQADGLQEALLFFRRELDEASKLSQSNIQIAYDKTMSAVSLFLRVLTLVAAETGIDAEGQVIKPYSQFEGWNEYVEPIWGEWSSTLHRLHAADISMAAGEEAEVARELCKCIPRWLETIGIHHVIDPIQGQFMYWMKNHY